MAQVTIREIDTTNVASTSIINNAVYVPGYSIMGPINEPVLCYTLDEFTQTFGHMPYKIKTNQLTNEQNIGIVKANDYEKSYMYAYELLFNGLPVLFERVETNTLAYASSTIQLQQASWQYSPSAQVSGSGTFTFISAGSNNYIYTSEYLKTLNPINYNLATLTLSAQITVDDVLNTYTITVDEDNENLTINPTLEGFSGTVDSTDGILTLTLPAGASLNLNVMSSFLFTNQINWTMNGTYNASKAPYYIDWTLKWSVQTTSGIQTGTEAIISDNFTETDNSVSYITSTFYNISFNKLSAIIPSSTASDSSIVIQAKYRGSYGANISYSITPTKIGGLTYYTLVDTLTENGISNTETNIISLDEQDSRYFLNIDYQYIDLSNSIIDQTELNLDVLALNEVSGNLTYKAPNGETEEFNLQQFYLKMLSNNSTSATSIFDKLADRNEYPIKYISSGAYFTYGAIPAIGFIGTEISQRMMLVAGNRGDCVALIDHAENVDILSVYNNIQSFPTVYTSLNEDVRKYGSMFTPWARYNLLALDQLVSLPASFAYLKCLAISVKSNANWYAVAGVTRGLVTNLIEPITKITGAVAEQLQQRTGVSINPITNINPYGYCIWGNRTLVANVNDLTASSFLNIRCLSCDVKKVVYNACVSLTYELDSDVLWVKFKSLITPTLDQMSSDNGLSNYKIIRTTSTKRATLNCTIKLYPIEAVEDFDITIELADSYVAIE